MKKLSLLAYGFTSYLIFFATFLYAIGFIGNVLVPKAIDGVPVMDTLPALAINLLLLSLFAIQHSVMARPFFKRWITRYIPTSAERSTYVLFSSVALMLVFVYWQPLGGVVWQFEQSVAIGLLYGLYAAGWSLVLVSTFLINHFDLFGLRQSWLAFRDRPYQPMSFTTPWLYRLVRHPLYVGWMVVFWAAPTMTATHLLFAVVTTAYILMAIPWEEKDLMEALPEYAEYKERVPALIPRLGAKKAEVPKAARA